jgi:hypothetical protein
MSTRHSQSNALRSAFQRPAIAERVSSANVAEPAAKTPAGAVAGTTAVASASPARAGAAAASSAAAAVMTVAVPRRLKSAFDTSVTPLVVARFKTSTRSGRAPGAATGPSSRRGRPSVQPDRRPRRGAVPT